MPQKKVFPLFEIRLNHCILTKTIHHTTSTLIVTPGCFPFHHAVYYCSIYNCFLFYYFFYWCHVQEDASYCTLSANEPACEPFSGQCCNSILISAFWAVTCHLWYFRFIKNSFHTLSRIWRSCQYSTTCNKLYPTWKAKGVMNAQAVTNQQPSSLP